MDKAEIEGKLAHLPLGDIKYFDTIDSTNNHALAWVSLGAPDLSLVIADEQTSGRGRMNRQWFTTSHSALAISLILRPGADERRNPSRMTGLIAVSLAESLRELGLTPQIKWPNDILLSGRKAAGILVESSWLGSEPEAFVSGLGVNVTRDSLPPDQLLAFPATCIEAELGHPIDRSELLSDILTRILAWRPRLITQAFMEAWENDLAFRGQQIQIEAENDKVILGELVGLKSDGSLKLLNKHGKSIVVRFGEVHLRPVA